MNRLIPILLVIYGFLICGTPLSRVQIGPMPLYFVDIAAFLVLFLGRRQIGIMFRRHRRISMTIVFFVFALLPTTASEYLRMSPLEPTYMLGRTLLHILTVWVLAGLLRDQLNLRRFMIGLACGITLTASIASLNSLPVTGPWIRAHVFSIPILVPQRGIELSAETRLMFDKGEAERGDSLLGKSNITGCVIMSILPFLIGAVRNLRFGQISRLLFNTAIIVSFFALLFTYSRSTYLGLALMLFGYILFERETFSKRFLPISIIAAVVIAAVGINSTFFKFDFVASKFDIENEQYAHTNQARLLSYTRPFELIMSDPAYVFRGAGRTDVKLREQERDASILKLEEAEMHSVFAASIFYRGFIAMLVLFYLYYYLIKTSYVTARLTKREGNPASWMAVASVISLVSILPPWAFTHYLVTKMSGHMHLFVVVALIIASLDHIMSARNKPEEKVSEPAPQRDKRILSRASHA